MFSQNFTVPGFMKRSWADITLSQPQKSTHIASFISNFTVGKEIFMVAHGADIGSVDIFRLYPGFHKNDLIGPPQI